MRQAFEAIWEHGHIIPTESIHIHEHTRLLVVVLDEKLSLAKEHVAQEAKRQSILASKHHHVEDNDWEANIDDSDWRA